MEDYDVNPLRNYNNTIPRSDYDKGLFTYMRQSPKQTTDPLSIQGILDINYNINDDNVQAIHLVASGEININEYSIKVRSGVNQVEFPLSGFTNYVNGNILIAKSLADATKYFGTCYVRFDKTIELNSLDIVKGDQIELCSSQRMVYFFNSIHLSLDSWAYKIKL